MSRNEFVLATAVILFATFLIGWLASWLVHRLARATRAEMGELERMAQDLHDAEEARDQAVLELEMREAELTARLSGAEAELRAAMDGLRESRTEVEELRDYIEQKLARKQAQRME